MTQIPKFLRDALDDFDTESFDWYIRKGEYSTLIRLYDLICENMKAGYPINEDHQACLLYPMKLWGKDHGRIMFEMKKAYWDSFKNPQPKLTATEKIEQRKQSIEALTSKQAA